MSLLSFLHMYLIVFENTSTNLLYRVGSPIIYCIFLLDFVMQVYHESYDFVCKKARFARMFVIKIIVLILLGTDEILIAANVIANGRQIHPFRIFRIGTDFLK